MSDFKDELKQLEKMRAKLEGIPDEMPDGTYIKQPKTQAFAALTNAMNQIAIVAKLAR